MRPSRTDPPLHPLSSAAGGPLLLLLGLYPLWWALGVQVIAWCAAAVPMGLHLLRRRRELTLPPGAALFAVFLVWVALSSAALTEGDRAAAYVYRAALYLSCFVILLYVADLDPRRAPSRRILTALLLLWGAAVVGGAAGLVLPGLQWTSPLEAVLPRGVREVPFIEAIVHPRLSTVDPLYDLPRPAVLFSYTNEWGAAVGVLTPVAVHALYVLPTLRARLLVAAGLIGSVVPVVVSINRGLWLSIALAVAYVVLRNGLKGRLGPVVGASVLVASVVLVVLASPLRAVVTERLAVANTSTRQTLYQASIDLALRSPVLGWGSPQSGEALGDTNDVSVGTHGQFWTVLVSQGIVGLLLFLGFLVVALWASRRVSSAGLWLHASVLVAAAQSLVYTMLPAQLGLAAVCLALCHRSTANSAQEAHDARS